MRDFVDSASRFCDLGEILRIEARFKADSATRFCDSRDSKPSLTTLCSIATHLR